MRSPTTRTSCRSPTRSRFSPATSGYILSVGQVADPLRPGRRRLDGGGGRARLGAPAATGRPARARRPYAAVGAARAPGRREFPAGRAYCWCLPSSVRLFVYEDALSLARRRVPRPLGPGQPGWAPRLPRRCSRLGALVRRWVGPAWLLGGAGAGPGGVSLAAVARRLSTGTFFPAFFDRASANPLAVFALDAIGRGLRGGARRRSCRSSGGSDHLFALAPPTFFALTAMADVLFHRGLPRESGEWRRGGTVAGPAGAKG